MPNISKHISIFLAKRLDGYGKKADFCRRSGISRSNLDAWLSGESAPALETFAKIMETLKIEPWELVQEAPPSVQRVDDHPIEECVRRVSEAALTNSTGDKKVVNDQIDGNLDTLIALVGRNNRAIGIAILAVKSFLGVNKSKKDNRSGTG